MKNTLESSYLENEMGTEGRPGKMERFLRDTGTTTIVSWVILNSKVADI